MSKVLFYWWHFEFYICICCKLKRERKKKACYNPSESIWQDEVLNLFRVEKTLEKSITKKKTFGKTAFCPKPYLPLTIPKTQLLKFGGLRELLNICIHLNNFNHYQAKKEDGGVAIAALNPLWIVFIKRKPDVCWYLHSSYNFCAFM